MDKILGEKRKKVYLLLRDTLFFFLFFQIYFPHYEAIKQGYSVNVSKK